MRILHVVVCLDIGGLERIVTDLALAQKRQGDEVHFYSLNPTEGFRAELEAEGIAVQQGAKRGGLDLRTIREIRRLVVDRRIDVVHTHNYMPNYYAAAALFGLRSRRPGLVNTAHDMGDRLEARKLRTLYLASVRATGRVAMVGRQVHERFVSRGWVSADKAVTVINGVPLERFRPSAERRAQARARLGYSESDFLIGAVGRLVPQKNHQSLVNVMPELLKRWPQARAVVIGGGELAEEVARSVERLGVAHAVKLTGPLKGVPDLLPAFDLFAMPSRTEGLSIALLEAAASGLPVVATRVGGNHEVIEDGRTGLLVPPEDDAAFLAALDRMIGDAAFRQSCRDQVSAWVRDHASIEAVSHVYRTLYEQAIAVA